MEKVGYANKRSQNKVSQEESLQRQINNLILRTKNTTSNCDAKKNISTNTNLQLAGVADQVQGPFKTNLDLDNPNISPEPT